MPKDNESVVDLIKAEHLVQSEGPRRQVGSIWSANAIVTQTPTVLSCFSWASEKKETGEKEAVQRTNKTRSRIGTAAKWIRSRRQMGPRLWQKTLGVLESEEKFRDYEAKEQDAE
ncbi:unnamed protein product [Caenorhabditis auriculariae]|uniref:Uncharacterized protein n=1 Tax=Caenorhabditis auriculariae TaxID=2777116 RepID=A0A8S1HK63_9PELO|nr:unnamed protein product [Caenorhabditis auriculariae]